MANPMSWYRKPHWRILVALALGLVYGVVAATAGWREFTADWVAPFGTIFLRLLLLIAVPLVLASLITGIASLSDLKKLSRIGGKTIGIYVGTTLIALIIGLTLVNLLQPGARVPDSVRAHSRRPIRATRLNVSSWPRAPVNGGRSSRSSIWCPTTSLAPRRAIATCSTWCSSPFCSGRRSC